VKRDQLAVYRGEFEDVTQTSMYSPPRFDIKITFKLSSKASPSPIAFLLLVLCHSFRKRFICVSDPKTVSYPFIERDYLPLSAAKTRLRTIAGCFFFLDGDVSVLLSVPDSI
jgi:hypothetical protein